MKETKFYGGIIMENKPKVTSVLYGFCGADKAFRRVRFQLLEEAERISLILCEQAASNRLQRNPNRKEGSLVEHPRAFATVGKHPAC